MNETNCSEPENSLHDAAPFAARTMALLIDLVLLTLFYLSLFLLLGKTLSAQVRPDDLWGMFRLTIGFPTLFMAGCFFLPITYFTVFHACSGQTIGKMFLGIRVVSTDRQAISPGRAFLRSIGYLVSAIPFAAGFFCVVLDRNHCAWHDKLAGTMVDAV